MHPLERKHLVLAASRKQQQAQGCQRQSINTLALGGEPWPIDNLYNGIVEVSGSIPLGSTK